MDTGFCTMRLPAEPGAVAPDGSDVRVLLQLGRGRVIGGHLPIIS